MTLTLCASLIDALLQLHLYSRPAPLGGPFALDASHYVFHAIYYGFWSMSVASIPFLALAIQRSRRGLGKHGLGEALQISTCFLLLLAGSLDRECQRFLGMHMSASWLQTYSAALPRTPTVIWDALRQDLGGAYSCFVGLAAAIAYVPLSRSLAAIVVYPASWRRPRWYAGGALVLLIWPTLLWNVIPGGKLRQAKVRPALLLLLREAQSTHDVRPDPAALQAAVAHYQAHWRARDASHSWVFHDPAYPFRKRHVGPLPERAARQPNIVLLSLETFRAKDMRSMNPSLHGVTPTPFLDQLAASPNSAYFRRYYTNGVPTVYAFMAMHASLLPHPSRGIHNEATNVHLDGFPAALRAHGYRAAHFTGSDPDWDSQRVWLNQWYDEVHFSPDDAERDRATFRRAAKRMRELGRADAPFFVSLSSISNHSPFRSPEPALDITAGHTARQRLQNTMHYTDDVVRELYESLQDEPWFQNTVWIVVGDHGFDLGERGQTGGHDNLRHETTWVPLIVHGHDPRLPRGPQSSVASHLDLAPTITELAGIWDDNSFLGHSLLHEQEATADALVLRGENYAYESSALSVVRRDDGGVLVYGGSDLEQTKPLALGPSAREVAAAERLAAVHSLLVRYTVDFDLVAPKREPRAPTLAAYGVPTGSSGPYTGKAMGGAEVSSRSGLNPARSPITMSR